MSDQKLSINDPALELTIDRHPLFVTPESPVTEIISTFDRLNLSGGHLESNNSTKSKSSKSANLDQFGSGYALVVSESFIPSQHQPETTPKLPMRSQILGIVTELDILRVTAREKNLTNFTAAELMNSEIISLNQADRPDMFAVLSLWRKHGMIPLLLYDQQEQLLGAIAPESIIYQNIQLQQTVVHQT